MASSSQASGLGAGGNRVWMYWLVVLGQVVASLVVYVFVRLVWQVSDLLAAF